MCCEAVIEREWVEVKVLGYKHTDLHFRISRVVRHTHSKVSNNLHVATQPEVMFLLYTSVGT